MITIKVTSDENAEGKSTVVALILDAFDKASIPVNLQTTAMITDTEYKQQIASHDVSKIRQFNTSITLIEVEPSYARTGHDKKV